MASVSPIRVAVDHADLALERSRTPFPLRPDRASRWRCLGRARRFPRTSFVAFHRIFRPSRLSAGVDRRRSGTLWLRSIGWHAPRRRRITSGSPTPMVSRCGGIAPSRPRLTPSYLANGNIVWLQYNPLMGPGSAEERRLDGVNSSATSRPSEAALTTMRFSCSPGAAIWWPATTSAPAST